MDYAKLMARLKAVVDSPYAEEVGTKMRGANWRILGRATG